MLAKIRIELLRGSRFADRGGGLITRRIAVQYKCARQMSLGQLRVDSDGAVHLLVCQSDPFFLFLWNVEHSVERIRVSQLGVRQCIVRIGREGSLEQLDSRLVLSPGAGSAIALVVVEDSPGVIVIG